MKAKYYIGKVSEVIDGGNFIIRFSVPGVIDNGKAFPLHTLHEPEVGDEIVVWGGDDLLNNLFMYCFLQSDKDRDVNASESVIMKAFKNYIQNVDGAGIELVSEDGDVLMDAGNIAFIHGSKAAGIKSEGPLHIEGKGVKLEQILIDIWTVLTSTATMYQAGGMPVTMINPGQLPNINMNISKLLGSANVPIMKDGSSSGSSSDGKSQSDPMKKTFNATTGDCIGDLLSFLDDIITFSSNLITGLSTIVTPMGPGSSPAGIVAATQLMAKATACKAQLTIHKNFTENPI